MGSRNPFAYTVTREQREREVTEQTQLIAQFEEVERVLGPVLARIEGLYDVEMTAIIVLYPEVQEAMGVSDDDMLCMFYSTDLLPENLEGRKPDRPDWYRHGESLAAELEARFGDTLYTSAETRKRHLKASKRALARAKKALAQ